jgi:hypothetical protein
MHVCGEWELHCALCYCFSLVSVRELSQVREADRQVEMMHPSVGVSVCFRRDRQAGEIGSLPGCWLCTQTGICIEWLKMHRAGDSDVFVVLL